MGFAAGELFLFLIFKNRYTQIYRNAPKLLALGDIGIDDESVRFSIEFMSTDFVCILILALQESSLQDVLLTNIERSTE